MSYMGAAFSLKMRADRHASWTPTEINKTWIHTERNPKELNSFSARIKMIGRISSSISNRKCLIFWIYHQKWLQHIVSMTELHHPSGDISLWIKIWVYSQVIWATLMDNSSSNKMVNRMLLAAIKREQMTVESLRLLNCLISWINMANYHKKT